MAIERTLSIIKPDAVSKNVIGPIIAQLEKEGLNPVAIRMMQLSAREAQGFYHVHQDKPFFGDLVTFMTVGPIVVMTLEGENAIERFRAVMGPTNPENAEPGTFRQQFGTNIERNAVHGSDSPETAAFETSYFFRGLEKSDRS